MSVRILLSAAVIFLLAPTALEAQATSPEAGTTVEQHLAALDAASASQGPAYKVALDQLDGKCREDRAVIGQLVQTTRDEIEKTHDTKLSLLEVLQLATAALRPTAAEASCVPLFQTIARLGP
jgi:hypothetical protein